MEPEEIDSEIEASDRLYSTRPNSHAAAAASLSRTLQPTSNRNHKFITHLQHDQAAFDPKTLLVLSKLLHHAIFHDLNDCVFTGKQANVYHATKHNGQEFAVKVFKDMDHNRFRRGNCKHNSRRLVKTWAENEMSNLLRLKEAGIRCPTPIHLRLHVLVMEFIGKSGSPAPSLQDANLSEDEMRQCYIQMIILMRNLYQKCKLVHGDLRENNILYHEGNLHIIDVSQSVDLDHPHAFHLLHVDCSHVLNFFGKNVDVVYQQDLFKIIVDSSIPDESVGWYLEESNIPRLARGPISIGFSRLINNPGTKSGTDDNEVDDDDSSDLKGVEPHETMKEVTRKTLSTDKKAARKENKKKVKEEKREARKTKTTKYVKKKKNKLSKK